MIGRGLLFASFLDIVFWALRVAIGVGGFILGWFFTPTVVNFFYRLAFHKPMPRWARPLCRLLGGLLLGFLFFYYVPLGGGGGLGWGPGSGGGAGAGPGPGGKKSGVGPGIGPTDKDKTPIKDKVVVTGKDNKDKKDSSVTKTLRQEIDIELLGGPRYKDDGRFYLWKRVEPALSIADVEEKIKGIKGAAEVRIVFVADSVAEQHPAVMRLVKLANKYEIPTLKHMEKDDLPKK